MIWQAPLPKVMQGLVAQNTHPGLMLDKYALSWDPDNAGGGLSEKVQKPTLETVAGLSQRPPAGLDFQALISRRRRLMSEQGAIVATCESTGPLTLHLARASALENAGICLHPVYGFVYLPGTGLKGMARALACEAWLPMQADQSAAWSQICQVFGWAPSPALKDTARHHQVEVPGKARAGAVVFHDAWPVEWPRLLVDILNNHHSHYYNSKDYDAPGDWENLVPVYFLAVTPGAKFEFPLAKRRTDTPDELLELAKSWLVGALCHFGAGAKTAAGYGSFRPVEEAIPPLRSAHHLVFETDVSLTTPAFLAGAHQDAGDCDLRPATLRGLLRWWWRTMHAGFVNVPTLRKLEADVWGDVRHGGAVRIEVLALRAPQPIPYDRRSWADMSAQDKAGPLGIPGSPPNKTTQGLWYASYGMDERQRRRHVVEPGAAWTVRLTARSSSCAASTAQVLDQAKAALWLLCHFGGVGSKAGKGFGSLQMPVIPGWDLTKCRKCAADFRAACQVAAPFREVDVASPSLDFAIEPLEVPFPWTDVWQVMDQVGFAYQAFAKSYAHRREKLALGLPRRLGNRGNDVTGEFRPTGPMEKIWSEGRGDLQRIRHASPVHFHVDRDEAGFRVRVLAMIAPFLPDPKQSRQMLAEIVKFLRADLPRRAAQPMPRPPRGGARTTRAPAHGGEAPRAAPVSEITFGQLGQVLADLAAGETVVKFACGQSKHPRVKHAPKIHNQHQVDGNAKLELRGAPAGLPDGTFVVAKDDGTFVRVIGKFPSPPPQNHRPRGRR